MLGRSRRIRPRISARRVFVGACVGAAAVLLAPAASFATSPAVPGGGTIGTFSFGGEFQGTLKSYKTWTVNPGHLVVAGCQISSDPTSVIIHFFNEDLKRKGKRVTLNGGSPGIAVQLEVDASQLGSTESLSGLNAAAEVTFNAFIKGKAYVWGSNTTPESKFVGGGTLTTTAGNKGGSLDATLIPSDSAASGPLTVKGSWSHCQSFKG
jgi:hypothetical protein